MKLPSKKLSIMTLSAIAVIATGAVSYATLNKTKPVVEQKSVARQEVAAKTVETAPPAPVAETTPPAPTPVPDPTPAPAPTKYPYATFNGNYWTVTDVAALVASAGINADARFVAGAMRPMIFTEDGHLMLANLQESVMKQKYGSVASPEDQVRTYNTYVMERYGSWEKASNMMSSAGWN